MDVSGRILRTWMSAIHAGMTKISISCFVGERKIMKHFVVNQNVQHTESNCLVNERRG